MSASEGGGIRFGQYVLLRRIARGGMAEVFLAQQRGLEGFDRRVAVKRILPHLADAPDFVKMFLGEAKLAAQLTHPNIVHIYDFGKHEGDYFIAMEFVDGVHAGQLFKHGDKEKMPPTMVARIGADAATALHYAHELRGGNGKPLGLVHRDVSPANLMVSFDGVVKLCDFGIAKAVAATDQLTNPGQVKGKYAYMSPEQTIAAPLDGRSDVFSLAIVLWELLVGRTIVPRGDAVDSMRMIRDGKLPKLSDVAPQTPPALAKAITWALQTRREMRATAMDLAQALESFIKSSPELATPMQLGSWIRGRFQRDLTGPQTAIPGVSVGTRQSGAIGGTVASDGTEGSPGTAAGPGTVAAPGTGVSAVSDLPSAITPKPALVSRPSEPTAFARPSRPGTRPPPIPATPFAPPSRDLIAASMRDELVDDLDAAETIDLSGAHIPAHEATVIEPGARAVHETTERDGDLVDPNDMSDETQLRSGAFKAPVGGAAIVPTRVNPAVMPPDHLAATIIAPGSGSHAFGAAPAIGSGPRGMPSATEVGLPRRAGKPRPAVMFAILGGVALLSFVIALAARSGSSGSTASSGSNIAVVPIDAAIAPVTIDAAPLVIAADAAVDAGPAVREPTIRPEEDLTLLEIRTNPPGGTVIIGGESRRDPAKFALAPGAYEVTATLDGWRDETRSVELLRGVDLVQEIAFMKKIVVPTRPASPQVGRLTVRTKPYAVVFHNGRRLGETPFADLELPAGTYQLVFRNPDRPTITKKVTITKGKTTKLSFDL